MWSLYRTASAYRAGLRPGDVIVAVDGKAGRDAARSSSARCSSCPSARCMTLGILREGGKREIKVQVEQQLARARAVAE